MQCRKCCLFTSIFYHFDTHWPEICMQLKLIPYKHQCLTYVRPKFREKGMALVYAIKQSISIEQYICIAYIFLICVYTLYMKHIWSPVELHLRCKDNCAIFALKTSGMDAHVDVETNLREILDQVNSHLGIGKCSPTWVIENLLSNVNLFLKQ